MADRRPRVAVIGAGMAGRAQAAGYRNLHSLNGDAVPTVKRVAIADANRLLAADLAGKFEIERAETSWEAIPGPDRRRRPGLRRWGCRRPGPSAAGRPRRGSR
jgi:hypothetical protein